MERAFCRLRNVACLRLALLDLLEIWAIKIDAMQVCFDDRGQGSLAVNRRLDVERADRSRYDPMHTAVTPPGALAARADLARALRFAIHGQSDRIDRRACQPVSRTCDEPCIACTMGRPVDLSGHSSSGADPPSPWPAGMASSQSMHFAFWQLQAVTSHALAARPLVVDGAPACRLE